MAAGDHFGIEREPPGGAIACAGGVGRPPGKAIEAGALAQVTR